MITHVVISNYRSIGDQTELHLGNLTALVGPNGSGKSNLADAFQFIADSLRIGLEAAITKRHGITAIRRWSAGHPSNVSFSIFVAGSEGDSGSYAFELGGARAEEYRVKREVATYGRLLEREHRFEVVDGEWKHGPQDIRPKVDPLGLVLPIIAADERFRPLAEALRNISIYSIFPDTLRKPQNPDPVKPMTEHGDNWCSILKRLKQEAWAPELKTALGQITGDIDDIRVSQAGGYLVAEFRHGVVKPSKGNKERAKWFGAAQESDGTLRMAGIITALLQEPPLTLIGVEEPELTIHPGAIPVLYDYLCEASSRSQVLITTHSPELLSLLKADEIRVVDRQSGVTSVRPMEESQRLAVRDRFLSLGDLMRMEGLRQASGTGG